MRNSPGRRPKPSAVKALAGNPGGRPLPKNEPRPIGLVERPAKLSAGAEIVWKARIVRAHWLTWADSEKAEMYCELISEYRQDKPAFPASKLAQIRNLGSELGFDPGSRARIGANLRGMVDAPPAHSEEEEEAGKNVVPITKSQKYFK